MAGLAFISWLLKFENVFCIFRNFCYLKKVIKYVAVVWAMIELVINVTVLYFNIEALFLTSVTMDTLFFSQFEFFFSTNTILVICLSFKNAVSFKSLYSEVYQIYDIMSKDSTALEKTLKEAKNFSLTITVIFFCNYMTMLTFYFKNFFVITETYKYPLDLMFTFLFKSFFFISSEIRFFTEFLSIIVLIRVVHGFLKSIHLIINNTVNILKKLSTESSIVIQIGQIRHDLNIWFFIICNLDKCLFYVKKCYSIQVLFSVFTVIIHFIFLMYKVITSLMQGIVDEVSNYDSVFLLTNYSMMIISMLYAGQMAKNEADGVRRALGQLHNILVTIPGDDTEKLRKSVKDLHRYVTVEPFKNQVMGGVSIQMALLPVILTTIISYTIVLLQFNHVV